MVVAIIALIVAVGGTAFAGPVAQLAKRVSGNKIIKKRSLSGNRLRKHTITGTEVKLTKLGTVPRAKTANTANLAANANALGGQPASAFFPAGRVRASGLVKASKGQTVTVLTTGPFTLTLKCEDAGASGAKATFTATSTEANSLLDNYPLGTSRAIDTAMGTTPNGSTGAGRSLVAPSGANFHGVSADGVNALGADCFASITGISS
jgi:hypothetical protein